MNVSEAVQRRFSARAFKSDPVPGALVRDILEIAHRAPSGGNLQPWRVYALTGGPLEALKAAAKADGPQATEYPVYPENLWDPFRTRRFQCGEDLYASIDIPREDRGGRFAQLAKNLDLFGAPVGLFFCIDRNLGTAAVGRRRHVHADGDASGDRARAGHLRAGILGAVRADGGALRRLAGRSHGVLRHGPRLPGRRTTRSTAGEPAATRSTSGARCAVSRGRILPPSPLWGGTDGAAVRVGYRR